MQITATPGSVSLVRFIKRYSNRKLYDVSTSTYVNLKFLARCLRDGETFEVYAHPHGKDITNETIENIVLDEIRAGGAYDRKLLTSMIRNTPFLDNTKT